MRCVCVCVCVRGCVYVSLSVCARAHTDREIESVPISLNPDPKSLA